jgi:uncharacterized damage-inducible protein DinB
MQPEMRHWVDLWDYLDGNFWGFWQWAVDHLTPAQVGWQPLPQVASVGWNLQHLGEMLDHYLAHVFRQANQVQGGPLFTMRAGSQDDGRYTDLQAIAAYHQQLRPAYRAFLSTLSPGDLDRIIERTNRRPINYGWCVGHIAEHESYHLGKCMLLRTLIWHRTPHHGK